MKKIIVGIFMVFGLFGFSQAALLDDAVSWMNTNGLTIFKTTKDYQPNNYIRKDEAAKLFVKFVKLRNKTGYLKTLDECKISDINDTHKDLKNIVIESCRLDIFELKNGKFFPLEKLSNKKVMLILLTLLEKDYKENELLFFALSGLKGTNMENDKEKTTRGDIAIVLYNTLLFERRIPDIQKKTDLQQLLTALQTYNLDKNIYPIYDTFVDTNMLSGVLVSEGYLVTIPTIKNSVNYYKVVSKNNKKNSGLVLMTKVDTNNLANFFGQKEDFDNKSFEEIQSVISNQKENIGFKQGRYVIIE